MTDRHIGYIVTLDKSIRSDCDSILDAIRMIKGVVSVRPVIEGPDHDIAVQKAKHEIEERPWKALREHKGG